MSMIATVYVTTMAGTDGHLGRFAWYDGGYLGVWVKLFGPGKDTRARVELTADIHSRMGGGSSLDLAPDWQLIVCEGPRGPFEPPAALIAAAARRAVEAIGGRFKETGAP